jgi:3-hydroxyisobutyrate dehydrogenase
MTRGDVVVGFVGLGIMGGRMATNLQKAGYNLVVHDLQRRAATQHLNTGASGRTTRARSQAAPTSFSHRCRSRPT